MRFSIPWLERIMSGFGPHYGARRKPRFWAAKRRRKQKISKASRRANRASFNKPKRAHAHA